MKNIITIEFKRKTYKKNKDKIICIFAKLENKRINSINKRDILYYLNKYKMLDEYILKNLI